jgi:hypothetical protein
MTIREGISELFAINGYGWHVDRLMPSKIHANLLSKGERKSNAVLHRELGSNELKKLKKKNSIGPRTNISNRKRKRLRYKRIFRKRSKLKKKEQPGKKSGLPSRMQSKPETSRENVVLKSYLTKTGHLQCVRKLGKIWLTFVN